MGQKTNPTKPPAPQPKVVLGADGKLDLGKLPAEEFLCQVETPDKRLWGLAADGILRRLFDGKLFGWVKDVEGFRRTAKQVVHDRVAAYDPSVLPSPEEMAAAAAFCDKYKHEVTILWGRCRKTNEVMFFVPHQECEGAFVQFKDEEADIAAFQELARLYGDFHSHPFDSGYPTMSGIDNGDMSKAACMNAIVGSQRKMTWYASTRGLVQFLTHKDVSKEKPAKVGWWSTEAIDKCIVEKKLHVKTHYGLDGRVNEHHDQWGSRTARGSHRHSNVRTGFVGAGGSSSWSPEGATGTWEHDCDDLTTLREIIACSHITPIRLDNFLADEGYIEKPRQIVFLKLRTMEGVVPKSSFWTCMDSSTAAKYRRRLGTVGFDIERIIPLSAFLNALPLVEKKEKEKEVYRGTLGCTKA